MTAVMAVEGVLRAVDGTPIPDGEALYEALLGPYKRILLLTSDDVPLVRDYLRKRPIRAYATLVGEEVSLPGHDLSKRQLDYVRSLGSVQVFVTADPALASWAMSQGVTTLLFCQPEFMRPEFRPDYDSKIKPWNDIVTEMDKRLDYRAVKEIRDIELGWDG